MSQASLGMAEAPQTTNDAYLAARVRRQDRRALAAIYERHGAVIYRLGLSILKDPREAEDLSQEVFLFFWHRGKDNFDQSRGTLLSYLITLTRSRALDRLRRHQTFLQTVQRWQIEVSHSLPCTPLETASFSERSERVRQALDQLSVLQCQALELAYFEGYSQSQIAEHLGEPLGTIKTRTRQGLLKLREALVEMTP